MITIGEYQTLTIARVSDLGYMLTDNKDEVLLHFKQAKNTYKEGDSVKVFIYADKAKRLTATEAIVSATIEDAGFATVVEIFPGAGVFVNINTPKDLLLSKDYLPYDERKWPNIGDKVFTNEMSENLWKLAQLKPTIPTGNARTITNNNAIAITLPNVTNYEQFKTALQNDPKMVGFIQQVTLGEANGSAKLNKRKY